MIRKPIAFPDGKPLTRTLAAQLVQITGRYESRGMIDQEQQLVNAKSMLGLLSLGLDDQQGMILLVEGPDEVEAASDVEKWLTGEG